MTGEQRRLTHQLLTSLLSARGYLKVVQIMQLEQILGMLDTAGLPRGVGHYEVVLFGTPSTTEPWSWRFEGHHVSLNVAVAPAGISVTPSFFGSNPAEVRSGPLTGFRVLGAEEDLARELVDLADGCAAQQSRRFGRSAARHLHRQHRQARRAVGSLARHVAAAKGSPSPSSTRFSSTGFAASSTKSSACTGRSFRRSSCARSIPRRLSFAWIGATERGAPHYFRLQGADFVFEYDNVQDNGNHVHSVWRNKSEDFGMQLLGEHYRTSHARAE